MTHDDLFCAEKIGIGLIKLTIYGKDPISNEKGSAEIILDEDDADELIENINNARRMKVIISGPT